MADHLDMADHHDMAGHLDMVEHDHNHQCNPANDQDWDKDIDSFVHGCSAGCEPKTKTTVITTSMLIAYAAMRNGVTPGRQDGGGPLVQAMLESNPKDQAGIVLREILDTMVEGELEAPTRTSVFEMPRQRSIEHLRFAPGMSQGDLYAATTAIAAPSSGPPSSSTPSRSTPSTDLYPDWDSDTSSDDGEGPSSTGRISPCTFAHWARGAAEYPHLSLLSTPPPTTPTGPRTRAPTPPVRPPSPDRWEALLVVPQVCRESGSWMSPKYSLPSEPSVVWTPPGADPSRAAWIVGRPNFDRMDPRAGKKLQAARYGELRVLEDVQAVPSEGETYSDSEVKAALALQGGPLFGGVAVWETEDFVRDAYEAIREEEREEERLYRENQRLKARLAELREKRGVVLARAVKMEAVRRLKYAKMDSGVLRKQERIREHVASHMRDLMERADKAAVARKKASGQNADLAEQVKLLEDEMQAVCRAVGKGTVEELNAEFETLTVEERKDIEWGWWDPDM